MSEADWYSHSAPVLPHRHVWVREGRLLEVCADCPAARPRSRVARGLSVFAMLLSLLALGGTFVGLSQSEPRYKVLAQVEHAALHQGVMHSR